MPHPRDYIIVFESYEDPITPPAHDDDSDERVYRCVTYVDGHVPERGVPRFANWEIEVVNIYRVDAAGNETKLPPRSWMHASDEIAAKVLKAVEQSYWDSV